MPKQSNLKIHFIWVGSHPLSYPDYLGLKSAEQIYGVKPHLWTDYFALENKWFLKCQKEFILKDIPSLWLQYRNNVTEHAQIADYVRYKILQQEGGLYLDTDTLCVKPIFDLNLKGLSIGEECTIRRVKYYNNAVMYIEKANQAIMDRIVKRCEDLLRDQSSVPHGGIGPRLLTSMSDSMTLLPKEYFYRYNWTPEELPEIWLDNPIPNDMYILHWWAGARKTKRQELQSSRAFAEMTVTPEYVKESDSLYAKVARQSLGDRDYYA